MRPTHIKGCGTAIKMSSDTQNDLWPDRYFRWDSNGEIASRQAACKPGPVKCGEIRNRTEIWLCGDCCVVNGLRW